MASNKIDEKGMKNMLVEVRRSYRFLYLFQQRVLDLVKFIGLHYQFTYHGGWSHYSSTIRKGKGSKLENWAWDWLPMYHYDFVFSTKIKLNEEDSETLVFSALLQCDSAYYDLNKPSQEQKKMIETFNPPESSKTFLHLILRENRRKVQDYKNTQVKSDSEEDFYDHSEAGLIIGRKIPLEKLINEEKTRAHLSDFAKYIFEKTNIVLKELPSESDNTESI